MQRGYSLPEKQLNKSRFVVGRQCPKALYIATHAPDSQPALTSLERKTLTTGNAVGQAARHAIPNGVPINSLDTNEALRMKGERGRSWERGRGKGPELRFEVVDNADYG